MIFVSHGYDYARYVLVFDIQVVSEHEDFGLMSIPVWSGMMIGPGCTLQKCYVLNTISGAYSMCFVSTWGDGFITL